MRADMVDDAEALEAIAEPWDRLAVERRRPYCAPGWMLAWWRDAAPRPAGLRTLVLRRGGSVLGIAPFFIDGERDGRARYRMLGSGAFREPLAAEGAEDSVAAAVAHALADAWPGPRRPLLLRQEEMPVPTLQIEGTFDDWFATKSSHFRAQMRRYRRQLEARGGSVRQAEPHELERAVEAFGRLHRARWEGRGGSSVLNAGVDRMLHRAAERLPPSRFRLWLIEIDGEIVSTHLFLAAGGEVAYWLGGFDEQIGVQGLSMVTVLAAVEQAFILGDRRLDLGAGAQPYKYRFADGEERLERMALVPRTSGSARVRARLLAERLRREASERAPAQVKARLKRTLRAVRLR
jgi:CelD/BcsL family acetyltransferase involved in cellulose biosynthesis